MSWKETKAVDKQSAYGTYLDSVRRRQEIADKAVHKALDLPDDDDVNITQVKSGTNPLAAGALALLGVVAGAGIVQMIQPHTKPQATIGGDSDTRYGYEFRIGEPTETSEDQRQPPDDS